MWKPEWQTKYGQDGRGQILPALRPERLRFPAQFHRIRSDGQHGRRRHALQRQQAPTQGCRHRALQEPLHGQHDARNEAAARRYRACEQRPRPKPITVTLQHQLRLHMFRPPTPASWTHHNINTPAVPFFGTVTSYVILYCNIHKNLPYLDGSFSKKQKTTSTRAMTRRLRYGLQHGFITPHCSQQNGMVERVISTLKERCTTVIASRASSTPRASSATGSTYIITAAVIRPLPCARLPRHSD